MIKIGDRAMIREAYIKNDYQFQMGTILEIGYHKDSTMPMVILIGFTLYNRDWFHISCLKDHNIINENKE